MHLSEQWVVAKFKLLVALLTISLYDRVRENQHLQCCLVTEDQEDQDPEAECLTRQRKWVETIKIKQEVTRPQTAMVDEQKERVS